MRLAVYWHDDDFIDDADARLETHEALGQLAAQLGVRRPSVLISHGDQPGAQLCTSHGIYHQPDRKCPACEVT